MRTPDHPHTPLAHRARLLLSRLALGALHRLDEEPLPIRAKLDRLVVTVVDDPSGMMRLVGVRGVVTPDSVTPLLDTLDVRIGIAHALNFQKVIDVDFRGDYTRMQSTFAGFGRFTNPNVKARPFDVPMAREHFAKAGFTTSGKDGVLVNSAGKRLSVTL